MKERSENKAGSDFLKTDDEKIKSNSHISSVALFKADIVSKGIAKKISIHAVNAVSCFSLLFLFLAVCEFSKC